MLIPLLIVLTFLALFIHELGHLTIARLCRVPCYELGLGLGPKLLEFRFLNIRFTLRPIPLGSFVKLEGSDLKSRPVRQQLYVHLAGIVLNLFFGFAAYGTFFGWINLLLAAGNLLPLYQHDGWKCGVVLVRALIQRNSQPAELAFTFSGGFASFVFAWAVIRLFI